MATSDIRKGPLYVDSTNNSVGIGTSSFSNKLHVESAGANYIVSRDSTSGGTAGVLLQNGSDTRGIRISGGDIQLHDHSANLTRLNIDTSGRVTMPYQPAFLASATGNANYTSVSFGTAFPANTAYKNVGGHYNTTTYRFTAPVDGFYLFCWSALTNNTTSQSRPTIMVNGSTSGHAGGFRPMAGNDPGALGNMFSTITYLSANDYVSAASDSGNLYFYGDAHSGFSGTLLS